MITQQKDFGSRAQECQCIPGRGTGMVSGWAWGRAQGNRPPRWVSWISRRLGCGRRNLEKRQEERQVEDPTALRATRMNRNSPDSCGPSTLHSSGVLTRTNTSPLVTPCHTRSDWGHHPISQVGKPHLQDPRPGEWRRADARSLGLQGLSAQWAQKMVGALGATVQAQDWHWSVPFEGKKCC